MKLTEAPPSTQSTRTRARSGTKLRASTGVKRRISTSPDELFGGVALVIAVENVYHSNFLHCHGRELADWDVDDRAAKTGSDVAEDGARRFRCHIDNILLNGVVEPRKQEPFGLCFREIV